MSGENFRNKIFEIAHENGDLSQLSAQSDQLMKAFLDFGSETPDNLGCYNHIEYGLTYDEESRAVAGLKLKGKELLLSEVMHEVENLELPNEVSEEFPELTNSEWHAITRMVTMTLIAFERNVWKIEEEKLSEFVNEIIRQIPDLEEVYEGHRQSYGRVIPYIIMDELSNDVIEDLQDDDESELFREFVKMLEHRINIGDEVSNIIRMSFCKIVNSHESNKELHNRIMENLSGSMKSWLNVAK